MNITCALSPSQVEKLYANVYGHMLDSFNKGQTFDSKAYMTDLFNKIASKKDADTAAKFLQQVPTLIGTASFRPSLEELDIKTDVLRPLIKKFKNPENGFVEVVKFFNPTLDPEVNKELVEQNALKSFSIEERTTEEVIKNAFDALPFSAMSTTFQEFLSLSPDKAEQIEKLDPSRKTIYNTLKAIRNATNGTTSLVSVKYQDRTLKLKPYRLSEMTQFQLDKTTKRLLDRANYLASVGKAQSYVTTPDQIFVMVLTDDFGSPIYFDTDGNITDAENGNNVYQFLRDVRKEKGRYKVTDIYGKTLTVMSPQDMLDKMLKRGDVTPEQSAEVLKALDKKQQLEFKELYDYRQKLIKNEETPLLNITGISNGIFEGVPSKLGLSNLGDFMDNADDVIRTIDTVKSDRSGFEKGEAVIQIQGNEFKIDRPNLTADLSRKIASMLVNKNYSNEQKYNFVKQFLSSNASPKTRRHKLTYLPSTDSLIFSYSPTTYQEIYASTFTPLNLESETAEADIYNVLMNASGVKGKYFPAKMSYNKELIDSSLFQDYNTETKELNDDYSSYIDLLKTLPNTTIFGEVDTNLRSFNSYVRFAIPNKVTEQLDKADSASTFMDPFMEALASRPELSEAEKIVENLRDSALSDSWKATVEQETGKTHAANYYIAAYIARQLKLVPNYFKSKETYNQVLDLLRNVYKFTDPQINVISREYNSVKKTLPKQAPAAPKKSIEEIENEINESLNPSGTKNPKENGAGDVFFYRKSDLPNDVSQKQIDDAKVWWNNSPLNKYIELKQVANIVNSDAFARFVKYGSVLNGNLASIEIATKGSMVDVYHEAWHGFSQLFLSPEQKVQLYNEVRERIGKDKSFFEIEETLAEEFRTYAKNGGKTSVGSSKQKSLFRRILNFIRKLFGKGSTTDVMEIDSVKEMFDKLYLGKDLNIYTPLIDNVMFDVLERNTGVTIENDVQILDRQDSNLLKDSMDSLISEIVDEQNAMSDDKAKTLSILLDPRNRSGLYNLIRVKLQDQLTKYSEMLENTPETEENEYKRDVLSNRIRVLTAGITNYGDNKTGLVKYHIDNSTFGLMKQAVQEVELDEEGNLLDAANAGETERYGDKKVGDKSLVELAGKETLYVLKSLYKIGPNDRPVYNELGFKKLVDFREIWNNTVRAIGGMQDPQKMYETLVEQSSEVKEFKQLTQDKLPNPIDSLNPYEFKLTTSFWQDFNKPRVPYVQLTVFKELEYDVNEEGREVIVGTKYNVEVLEASVESRSVLTNFENKFKADLSNPYIERVGIENTPVLNLSKVVKDFSDVKGNLNINKSFEFARAIGFYLDDTAAIKNALTGSNKDIEKYGLPYIFEVVKTIERRDKSKQSTATRNAIEKFKQTPVQALMDGFQAGVLGKDPVDQKKQAISLAELQARNGYDSSNFAVFNAEKNLVFEHIEGNSITKQVTAINNATKLPDLWTNEGFMSHMNPEVNPYTNKLTVVKTLFDMTSPQQVKRKDKSLYLFMDSGTQSEETGTNTTSLDVTSKMLQEINTMLKDGVQEFMRHASKSSSFGAKIDGGIIGVPGKSNTDKHLYVDIDMFKNLDQAFDYAFKAHLGPYMQGEAERIFKFKQNREEFSKYAGYNRDLGNGVLAGEVFTIFDDVLSDTVKRDIYEIIDAAVANKKTFNLAEELKNNPKLLTEVKRDARSYFNKQSLINYNNFLETKFLDPKLLEKTDGDSRQLIEAYTYNSWIHNFEMGILFYGDFAQYNHDKEEMHKRNTGSTSGGRALRTDVAATKFVNSYLQNNSYAKAIGKTPITYNGTVNTAIVQDVSRDSVYAEQIEKGLREDYEKRYAKANVADAQSIIDARVKKEVAKYLGMEEGDGQGWITFDSYRMFKWLENDWSNDQEVLFQKILNGLEVPTSEITELFPPLKYQNFGFLKGAKLPLNGMHKFSLAPMIPSVIAGSDLEALHLQMMNKNIQYITFQTGSKTGSVMSQTDSKGNYVADKIYADSSQKSIIQQDPNDPTNKTGIQFTPNVVYAEYLKNVTAVPTKYKNKTVFSTQLRKLVLNDLYDNGQLIGGEEVKSAVAQYERLVDEYSSILKQELLNEIGFEEKDGKYTGNIQDFLNIVQSELERRDMPEHLVQMVGLNKDKTIKVDLSLHLKADDIEKILVALVEKRLIKQKVKGEALVQVSSALTNGMWDRGLKQATKEEIQKYLGSNNLPFYNREDPSKPTSAMKVAISLQGDFTNLLKLQYKGEPIKTRQRLNQAIKDEEWLNEGNNRKSITLSAVRIPVQGLNSMEFMEVYEFLDPAASNIIIPPSEIVAKSGADFDIDKLTTFMPSIDERGQYVDSKMTNEEIKAFVERNKNTVDGKKLNARVLKTQKHALENKLIESIANILSLPENYATLVRPNDTYLLKDEIADVIQDDVIEYDRFANMLSEDYKVGKKGGKVISPTRILEAGYNLHKHDVNMIGKKVLGMIAIDNSLHPIFNSIGAHLPKTYKAAVFDEELNKYVDTDIDYDTRLFLPHNKTERDEISLSGISSVDGKDKISDLFNQMMNGAVDVEKDAWIFFIQGNYEITPMITFLLKAGVPKEDAILFVSNPIVREYAKQQRLIKSDYAKMTGTIKEDFMPTMQKYQAAVNALAKFGFKNGGKLVSNKNFYKAVNQYVLNKGILNSEGTFDTDKMRAILKNPSENLDLAVGMFLHFIELEKLNRGFSTLKLQSNPDTKTSKTIQEVIRRTLSFEDTKEISKLPEGMAERMERSILGSFFDNKLISDIILPLFPLRNNAKVTDYIMNRIQTKPETINKNFGRGQDGIRQFITSYKNAIPNYIFQNYMSNMLDETGEVTANPTEYKNKAVINKSGIEKGVKVEGDKIYIDQERLSKEYTDKLYTLESTAPGNYASQGLVGFPASYNMFLNESSYVKYAIEREYQRSMYPLESLETNKDYLKFLDKADGDANVAYENYINQRALINAFNRKAIMEMPGNYTDMVLEMTDEFSHLKAKFPILGQLTKIKPKRTSINALTLNDTKILKDPQVAEIYFQNLTDLADETVLKVADPEDNKRISKLFSLLPMMMIYQHGIGYSKYGFTSALPYDGYIGVMQTASDIFLKNNMNQASFDRVFTRLTATKGQFKDYTVDPSEYKSSKLSAANAQQVEEEEVLEASNPLIQALLAKVQRAEETSTEPEDVGTTEIDFLEDQSTGYAQRTKVNASADATIALATDFTSAGEKLTKSTVLNQNKKYIPIDANTLTVTQERVDKIVDSLNSVNAKSLNIAGNGIYTMKNVYTQEQVDDFTYELLKAVTESPRLVNKITSLRSGGQTGFDEAGAKAGIVLGIPTTVLAPKGWKFRNINGQDISDEQAFKNRFTRNLPTEDSSEVTPPNQNSPEGLPPIGRSSTNCQ